MTCRIKYLDILPAATLCIALAIASTTLAQGFVCGASDSLDYSLRLQDYLAKGTPSSFELRVVFVDFADNPDMSYTQAMETDLWTELEAFLDRQSRGKLDFSMEIIRDPAAPDDIWTAFETTNRYSSGEPFGEYPRYASTWYPTWNYAGELQAEILTKIQLAFAGMSSPFEGADMIVFLYLPAPGETNPLCCNIGGYGELAVRQSHFPILANAAADPGSPIRPRGIVNNWWGGGADFTWSIGTIVAHEFGHSIGLQHPGAFNAFTACGDQARMESYYFGAYNLMRMFHLGGYTFQPFHESDLAKLGWVDRIEVSANLRGVEIEDIRSGGSVYHIANLDPAATTIGGAPFLTRESFSIALHGGVGDDARIVPAGGPMYKSTGLAIWHSFEYEQFGFTDAFASSLDLETASGRFSDLDHYLEPDPAYGWDNMDVWFDRQLECAAIPLSQAKSYPGAAGDFFSGAGAEFSYRTNPSTANCDNNMAIPPGPPYTLFVLPQTVENSIVIRVVEDRGTSMTIDILLAPYEDVSFPNGGEVLQVGESCAIAWTKEFTTDQPDGIVDTVDIYCDRGEGHDSQLIAAGVDATLGSYEWTPEASHVGDACKIRIVYHNVNDATHVGEDESDETFVVVDLSEAKLTDVSSETGISYTGQPYSAVPGDLQADSENDLLVAVTGSEMSLNSGAYTLPSGAPFFDPSSPFGGMIDGRGVAVADYDNDGDQDIFVAHATTPKLWRNYGGQYFDVAAASGLVSLASGSLAAAWGDYDRDGWLDLFVTRGAAISAEPPSEMNISAAQPRLFRNLGNGSFADVTAAANLSGYMNACVSPSWGDIDGDGYPDIVALDLEDPTLSTHLVFMNQGNGTFIEQFMTRLYHPGVNMLYVTGVVLEDMNNDGHLDIVYSSAGAGSSVCFNDGSGSFHGRDRVLFPPIIGEVGSCYSGLQVFDLDLDGWKDVILISTSAGAPSRSFACAPTPVGVTFLENTTAVGLGGSSKAMGSAAADFTRDGDFDLFVGRTISDGQYFYKTDAKAGANSLDRNYVKIRLASPLKANNWQGIGATVSVTAGDLVQTQVVDGSSGRGGQRDRDLIFGLGDFSGPVTAAVKWPRGHVQSDISLFVSGSVAGDSLNTVIDETMVISNLNATAYVVPGTTLYDWVFSWDTNSACDTSLDALTIDQAGIQNPCWPGWTVLTPSTPGVVYTYEPKPGGGYLHQFAIYGQECNLNCSFRYSAFSAMGANQATSTTKTKQVKFCPSGF